MPKNSGVGPSGKATTEPIRENIKNATCSWNRFFFLKMQYSLGTRWLLSLELIFTILALLYQTVGY